MPTIDNPIINNIIPFISKDERYNLFIIVDELLEGNYIEKAKALEVKQSAYYQYKKRFLFCWDDVPGKDNKRLMDFLKNDYGIGWVKRAKIDRINNDKTVRLYTIRDFNVISLTLNDKKTKVNLKIEGGRTSEFITKKENGKLNIYKKNLEISNAKTLLLLKILHDKNAKKFSNFLVPIILRVKKQVSIAEDCINSGLLGLDFSLPVKLFDIRQKYDAFSKDLQQKQIEAEKQQKISSKKSGMSRNSYQGMARRLYEELQNHASIGEIFSDGDPQTWKSDYYFWRKIAKKINLKPSEIKLTKAKIPSANCFETIFSKLRERYNEGTLCDIEELMNDSVVSEDNFRVQKRDHEEKLKDLRETLRREFNSAEGLTSMKMILNYCWITAAFYFLKTQKRLLCLKVVK